MKYYLAIKRNEVFIHSTNMNELSNHYVKEVKPKGQHIL